MVLVAGNFLVSGIGSRGPLGTGEAASNRKTQGPTALVFDFTAKLDSHRISVAAAVLAREEARTKRREKRLRELRPFLKLPAGVSRVTLEAIASCESGGDPKIVSSSGLYHGKYQFSPATWEAVGGTGLPSEASEIEQDYRAALLYAKAGPGQWPVCGL
ncbi:MAG: transglycosylase family protein [Solirubrobacterales bacterium]